MTMPFPFHSSVWTFERISGWADVWKNPDKQIHINASHLNVWAVTHKIFFKEFLWGVVQKYIHFQYCNHRWITVSMWCLISDTNGPEFFQKNRFVCRYVCCVCKTMESKGRSYITGRKDYSAIWQRKWKVPSARQNNNDLIWQHNRFQTSGERFMRTIKADQ